MSEARPYVDEVTRMGRVHSTSSCGFLVVGRPGQTDAQGNPIEDPIGLFPSSAVVPVLYSLDGNSRGTLRVTTPSNSKIVVTGYTWRGPGAMGTLVFEPMPH